MPKVTFKASVGHTNFKAAVNRAGTPDFSDYSVGAAYDLGSGFSVAGAFVLVADPDAGFKNHRYPATGGRGHGGLRLQLHGRRAAAHRRRGLRLCRDGYPRHGSTGMPVLVTGARCRMVGRVSMDMITVDLTPVPDAGMGSEVILWGRSAGGAALSIDEVALAAGTVGYELMCALAARVPMA